MTSKPYIKCYRIRNGKHYRQSKFAIINILVI